MAHLAQKTLALALAFFAQSALAQTVIYESVGAHGEVLYTQLPPEGKPYKTIEMRADGRINDPGQMAGQTSAQTPADSTTDARVAELERQVKVQEQARMNQYCQGLKNNLTAFNSGDRVYDTDPQGNRKYLDSSEINSRRERTQQAISQYCQ